MARDEKPEDPPPSDIPFWFITYSDVITLMMTFFILLLTFATSEPENFVQMQVAVFQGSGGNGVAGEATGAVERDSLVHRVRPSSSRRAVNGSETAPLDSDPSMVSLDLGLKGMEEEPDAILAQGHAIVLSLNVFVQNGRLTDLGRQRLRMLSHQLLSDRSSVVLQTTSEDDLSELLAIARSMESEYRVSTGKLGVGMASEGGLKQGQFRILFRRDTKE